MDATARLFDGWARSGRSELMEREHGRSVRAFLAGVRLGRGFSFLDVGCGNGWAVRAAARMPGCARAVGIDKSPGMVRKARAMSASPLESYEAADVESWRRPGAFDYALSMESLYYARSVEGAARSVLRLLRPGGRFFCGTDFYSDNEATAAWQGRMGVPMRLLSEAQWRAAFRAAGFEASSRRVRDPSSRRRWRREHGTLFVTGRRPRARRGGAAAARRPRRRRPRPR